MMPKTSKPYRVSIIWSPDTDVATWLARAPNGAALGTRYTLEEIDLLTGVRPFPPRGLRRLLNMVRGPRRPNLPGPWAERETSVVQRRIEDWGRRAGRAWSCEHARRELHDDEIVYEFEIFLRKSAYGDRRNRSKPITETEPW